MRGQLKNIFQKLFRNLKNNTFEIYSNFKHKETPGEAGRNHESVKWFGTDFRHHVHEPYEISEYGYERSSSLFIILSAVFEINVPALAGFQTSKTLHKSTVRFMQYLFINFYDETWLSWWEYKVNIFELLNLRTFGLFFL